MPNAACFPREVASPIRICCSGAMTEPNIRTVDTGQIRRSEGGDESEQEPGPDVLAHLFALLTVLHRA